MPVTRSSLASLTLMYDYSVHALGGKMQLCRAFGGKPDAWEEAAHHFGTRLWSKVEPQSDAA